MIAWQELLATLQAQGKEVAAWSPADPPFGCCRYSTPPRSFARSFPSVLRPAFELPDKVSDPFDTYQNPTDQRQIPVKKKLIDEWKGVMSADCIMKRYFYSATINRFLGEPVESILGELAANNPFALEIDQRTAWLEQITILKACLASLTGTIYFEYSIPRMGRRVDVVLVVGSVVFVLEFKVGEAEFQAHHKDQVTDYALDLKNFHETSHSIIICPILVATKAISQISQQRPVLIQGVYDVLVASQKQLNEVLHMVLEQSSSVTINADEWERGRYKPTPTIIEAATALFGGHSVEEISRSDAGAKNLAVTSKKVAEIIADAKRQGKKAICFVTGVPGAGKTLVGLNVAKMHSDKNSELYSVYLSGNGPLVAVLHEALARDRVGQSAKRGPRVKKGDALREVKAFVQNVHHFRDECLRDDSPPIEHVALFDEAQRAWGLDQTAAFMQRKKGYPGFNRSEPDFLVSCLDRHPDWAAVVCLVGGGQEINTGEAGIVTWLESILDTHEHWHVHVSSNLSNDYQVGHTLNRIPSSQVHTSDDLHLSTSMRSFRAENVSDLVKHLLDIEEAEAKKNLKAIVSNYPIKLTRDLEVAKKWLRTKARGTERTGIVVSSQAERLRPQGIHVKAPMDPVHWFLGTKDDVRSSYYLEDVATEFHVQGLEVDWACVTWDADLRMGAEGWEHWSFKGSKWQRIHKKTAQRFQINAYRVLMTRARQGMVIVVPEGDKSDHTRRPEFYDPTFEYLAGLGLEVL